MSRKIEHLCVPLQGLYWKFDHAMKTAGLGYIVTCTLRTLPEQMALYAQGRMQPEDVNRMREVAELEPISTEEALRRVTWTLKSKHLKGEAFDIARVENGKVTWRMSAYEEAGVIGESVGLKWGGRFKTPDRPHFEI